MKKRLSTSIMLTLGLMIPAFAAALVINEFKVAPGIKIYAPLQANANDVNPFDTAKFLKSRFPLLEDELQNWTTVSTDSTGTLSLEPGGDTPLLHTASAHLKAERFSKGTLKLTTPGKAEVWLNGKPIITKHACDSTNKSATGSITLQPQTDYRLDLSLLSGKGAGVKAPEFKLEYLPDAKYDSVPVYTFSNGKRRFEIEDINLGLRVSSTTMSPDGKYVLMRYTQMYDSKTTVTYNVVAETTTGKTILPRIEGNYNWMPTGSTLYYTIPNAESFDMMTLDPYTGENKLFASRLPEKSFTVSPDSQYIIYYDQVEGKKETDVMRRYRDQDDRIPGNRDRYYPVKYDLKSRIATPLVYGGPSATVCDISKDSQRILMISTRETPSEYPFYSNTLLQLNAETLQADTILDKEPFLNHAIYSPDGKQIFITGGPSTLNNIGLNAGEHETPNNFDVQGFIYNLSTKEASAVTKEFNPSIAGNPVWSPDGRIYFRAADGFNTPVYSLDTKTGLIKKLPLPLSTISNFSVSKDKNPRISYVGQDFGKVGEAGLYNSKTQRLRTLDTPFSKRMDNTELGDIKPWIYHHSDGTAVDGVYCLPPDFDPAKKYPLIVYYYAGTTPSTATMHHPYTPHLFASKGYVVYIPNPSGTIGYGQEFSARHVNAWGKRTAEEIIQGTKEFCKTHPYVNDKKIGCIGASYGGFMTQYLQTLTDMFACAVSHAGISNVTSYWGEGFWGYSYNAVAAAKNYPWSNPKLFTEQGSLFNADKIHTPLLLLHGTDDTNVPVGESIQLFNALKILGRDVEFITVEGQNHIITDYEKRKLWHATIMAWFAKYLQDDPGWWNSLYGK